MEFGKFFRQKRTSLGISVREFCRRNSLDPSNLSRLELGRVRPPQSKEILDSYAKALDLQPESAQWHTFFELAALENGMISPQIQESQVMRGKLPKIYRQMREQTKYQKSWTTALDIERWADSYGAPSTLPRLVRKLVRSTTKKLVRAEFSAGEGIRRPGFDGIVEASEGNDFVPTGVSVWEIGTDNRPATKAKLDFDKRSEKPPIGLDTRQLVFIFITPRKWVKKNEWCEEKKKRGIWKDVRVYDSSDLEEWLETSTSTDIWFSTLIGRRPEGITDIREHWENLATLANPNFQPDVFLVSRDKDIDTLKKWFEGPAASLIFEAHSSSEVIDFISAYIASVPDDQRDILESRYIIVEDRNAWNLLCTSNSRFVLIPKPSLNLDPEMISGAVRQDHHVLLCSKRFSNESPEPHKLSRVYNYDLEKALIKSGFGEVEARRLADEAGGSLTILKRRLHGVSSINKPDWCKSSEVKDLLPILLLGAWNDTFKGDQKIIATMAERSYQDVLLTANRWLSSYDPVIMRVHSSWSLISRDDSWELLAPNLSAQQLDSFEKIAVEVLSENDPQYDLPANERWFASVKNKTPKVSARLKEGISETLVLLGTEVRSSVISVPISPVSRAERVVRKLATGADWKRWASLNLPLLAEASPEVFLDAVEKDLESPKPQLPILFIENGESFMSSCMHAGLLWALEALAWSPAYLSRSILTLARLAESDPGGKWSNRPINSLIEIFLPWLPQTTATVDQRIIVLEKLIEEMPQVGSKLLLSLLPSSHSSSFHTNRPSWRGWALGWSSHVTNYDYCKETEWCAEKLVQNLAKDDGLWEKVIDKIEYLTKKALELFIKKLQDVDINKLASNVRQQIFNALREKINRHRSFSDANWAMPEEILRVLDVAKQRFEPTDIIQKYMWLFVGFPELPEGRHDFEKSAEVVFEKRLQVLKEILEKEGINKIIEFSQSVEVPYAMGVVLGKSNLLGKEGHLVLELIASKKKSLADLAAGYAVGRFMSAGWEWVTGLGFKKWHYAQSGNLLIVLPFERKTWNLVESCGNKVIKHYWAAHSSDFYRGHDPQDVEYIVSNLLQHQRPFRAIDILSMAKHNKCEISPTLVMDVLEAALKLSKDVVAKQIKAHDRYEIQELFKFLQFATNVDEARLTSLEWSYLNLLDEHSGVTPKTLHKSIQSDPKFFAHLLSLVFRSKNEPRPPQNSITEQQKSVAQNAYKLLISLKSIPGTQTDGSVDEKQLTNWVIEARSLCKESGRLEVCDSRIGEMFAYAPKDVDKSWPCIAVRNVIEKIKSDKLDHGFGIGIFNKRGTHWKSQTDGGKEEHALSKQYSEYADHSALRWPRTAAVLRRMANNYERDARLEDEEAEARLN